MATAAGRQDGGSEDRHASHRDAMTETMWSGIGGSHGMHPYGGVVQLFENCYQLSAAYPATSTKVEVKQRLRCRATAAVFPGAAGRVAVRHHCCRNGRLRGC